MSETGREKKLGQELIYSALAAALIGGLLYGGLQLDGSLAIATFVLVLVAYVLFGVAYLTMALAPDVLQEDLDKDLARGEAGDIQLFLLPVTFVLCFALVFYGANKVYPGVYFQESDLGLWAWLLFALDAILQVVTLDFLDVYELEISPIGIPESFVAKTVLYSYKVVLSVGLVSVFLQTLRAIRAAKEPSQEERTTKAQRD